ADGREVLRVREEDRPLVADPLVEVDLAFRGLGREIGGFVDAANRNVSAPWNCLGGATIIGVYRGASRSFAIAWRSAIAWARVVAMRCAAWRWAGARSKSRFRTSTEARLRSALASAGASFTAWSRSASARSQSRAARQSRPRMFQAACSPGSMRIASFR